MADYPTHAEVAAKVAAGVAGVSTGSGRIWRSGSYYAPVAGQRATDQPGNGDLRLVPVQVPNAVSVSEIACWIATAGSTGAVTRLVICTDVGGRPGTVVYCSAALVATATGKLAVTGLSVALPVGRYYFGAVTQGSPTTLPIYNSIQMIPEMIEQPDSTGEVYVRSAYDWYGATGAISGSAPASPGMDAADAPRVQVKIA